MLRRPHVCIRWLPATALVLWATTSTATEYPGPAPGKAEATIVEGKLQLENAVLALRWEVKDGRLLPAGVTDKQSTITTPKGGELFRLVLADGKTIRASDLVLAPNKRLS